MRKEAELFFRLPQKPWRTARSFERNDGTAASSLGYWNNAPWRTGLFGT